MSSIERFQERGYDTMELLSSCSKTHCYCHPTAILWFDSVLGLFVYGILVLSSFILPFFLCCKPNRSVTGNELNTTDRILGWIETIVEHVFDNVLEKHTSRRGIKIYTVLNYKAPKRIFIIILAFLLIHMVAVAAVQFCDDFFIEESHDCITNGLTCCYSEDLWSETILDCSNKSYSENSNITCYRFVSNLGDATGSALGVVTTIALVLYIITICMLKASKGKKGTNCRKCCTMMIQVITALSTIVLTGLFCWLKFLSYFSLTKKINAISEILPTGIIISLYIIFFPWYKFKTVDDNDDDDEDDNDDLCCCFISASYRDSNGYVQMT